MASLNQPIEDEKNQQPGAPVSTGNSGGAASGGGQTAGGGASPVAQNAAPQANAGYTDVATYLDANKAGSQDLGNRVASNLTNTYNTTKSGIDQSAQGAIQGAKAGYTPENTDLIKQVASDPVSASKNANAAAQVQAQLEDSYTGPTSWADQGTLQGKVNEANQKASLTTAPGGLNVLTQEAEGQTGGNQSQGINQLDTLLLGGSPDAMSTVQASADPYKTLNDYINQQNMAVGSEISTGQNAAATAQANAKAALLGPTGVTGKFDSELQTQLQGQRDAAAQENARVLEDLKNQGVTDADIAALGITSEQWDPLRQSVDKAEHSTWVQNRNAGTGTQAAQVDLPSYLIQKDPNAALTLQNTANADQYAKGQALQQILGKYYANQLTDPTQAGTAPKHLSTLDYLDATSDTQKYYADQLKQAQAWADAEQARQDQEHDANKGGFLKSVSKIANIVNPVAVMGNKAVLNAGKKVISNV